MKLAEHIANELIHAVTHVPDDVLQRLLWAQKTETSEASKAVLAAILKNLEIADAQHLPMCQDTGMFLVFVDVGKSCPLGLAAIEAAILEGCSLAVDKAYYRHSVVEEPVYARNNTLTNLPPVMWWQPVEGSSLTIQILLKGFGSENCCQVRMLNPTCGEEGVIEAVGAIVQAAGGKPCPPIFLGVGLGGSMDRAAYLSKRALLRPVNQQHTDAQYASLEEKILAKVQQTEIGSGGLGGTITALSVAIEHEPTHIAGLPLAVSINCWADRKAKIVWEGEDA
ncbi:MAG: fumarate hydratase [Spirochaetales bacterium]|jgi:fumarate hydratase subunit alpha|nr:fumarate hydratase [Spirochaetales bacterium]